MYFIFPHLLQTLTSGNTLECSPQDFTVIMFESWERVSQQKKAQQASRIPSRWRLTADFFGPPQKVGVSVLDVPRTCGILTERELKITEEYDATALATEIRAGRLKCVEVTQAFCKV
jgi:amidase